MIPTLRHERHSGFSLRLLPVLLHLQIQASEVSGAVCDVKWLFNQRGISRVLFGEALLIASLSVEGWRSGVLAVTDTKSNTEKCVISTCCTGCRSASGVPLSFDWYLHYWHYLITVLFCEEPAIPRTDSINPHKANVLARNLVSHAHAMLDAFDPPTP
jgi:hypothetical protein